MEGFESKLAEATRLGDRDLLGAVAVVIDNKALQLVERDILTLDEPISKYIPEIKKCLLIEEVNRQVRLRPLTREITLRHLLLNTSGMGNPETYQERFGNEDRVPPLDLPDDAHPLAKNMFTHLDFEPGEGFEYGRSIYCVQLLVERLGDKDRFTQYIDEHIFGALGMTASTYRPALEPHVWKRRLQMVERKTDASKMDGNDQASLVACDKETYGLTCSIFDLALLFSDLMSPTSKLLQRQEHRDLFFTPQLTRESFAHQSLLAEITNYGFLLPLQQGVSHKVSWALTPSPAVNWTAAGVVMEEDNTISGTGIPGGSVSFEGKPNIIWIVNRERGRMLFFGTQLLPGYDVKAHNLAVQFMYDAWKTFG
ncbi:beta-lactamase family protein [Sarocladium strictum]